MSDDKWRDMGLDAAHEDIAQKGDSCATIEEARVRVGAWLRDSDATADDVEACAQGYLAGWSSTVAKRIGVRAGLDHAAARLRRESKHEGDAYDVAAKFVEALRVSEVTL